MATVVDTNQEVGRSAGPFGRMNPEVLEDADLAQVRLGRNRFLKRVGVVCFGAAMAAAVEASPAAACTAGSIPQCGPSPRCCCCNAWSGCCDNGCSSRYSGCGNGYGWYTCYAHYQYFCADYWSGGDKCLCANPTGAHC